MAVAKKTEQKRSRASQRAITAALASIKAAGLVVEKVCVNGGQVEIHIRQVPGGVEVEEDDGLESW